MTNQLEAIKSFLTCTTSSEDLQMGFLTKKYPSTPEGCDVDTKSTSSLPFNT